MPVIHIGPNSFLKKKLWKEYQTKKFHPDVTLVCDDGTTVANKLFLAAQSKFLKNLLKNAEVEMSEIVLPGIKVKYVERVLRFMYSGKLTVTNAELYKNYLVWHVKEIIKHVFRLDANLDLGSLNLEAPPDDWVDPDPDPGPGPGGSGGGLTNSKVSGNQQGDTNSASSQKESRDNGINFSQDSGGFRQHAPLFVDETQGVSEPTNEIEACYSNSIGDKSDNALPNLKKVTLAEESANSRLNQEPNGQIEETEPELLTGRMSSCSDIVEIEAPQAPSPDVIDLIDSDEDGVEGQGDTLYGGDNDQATIVMDNAEDGTERVGGFELSEAPKMLSRLEEGDVLYEEEDDGVGEGIENDGVGVSSAYADATNIEKQPSPRKKRVSMLKKRRKKKTKDKINTNILAQTNEVDLGNGIRKIVLPIATSAIKKETPIAQVIPYNRSEGSEQVERPQIAPGMVVFRGKVVSQDEVPKKSTKPAALIGGVRKYNPNGVTLTGIRKVESLITIKGEKAIHPCPHCSVRFEVYKSLEVHIQRTHNEKKTPCPECGKGLSGPGSIKKHLLTHRPESEWPHECPICHKKFQARADIPKHLMTSVHKDDNIPARGSPEWFALLYPEKKNNMREFMKNINIKKEKEREKLQQFPEELGLTLEEFDEFTNNEKNSTNATGQADSGEAGPSGSGPRTAFKRRAEDGPDINMSYKIPNIPGLNQSASSNENRRPQRTAAANAREMLHSIGEDWAL